MATQSRVEALVRKYISEARLNERLGKYPRIRHYFAKPIARGRIAPYYCHPLEWRLGTWASEDEFVLLEDVLGSAEKLPGWGNESGLFQGTDYGEFWNLLWQLKVAEWLVRLGLEARWNNPGPDLEVKVGEKSVWVECYNSVGAYPQFLFLEELLAHIDSALSISYEPDFSLSTHAASIGYLFEACLAAVEDNLESTRQRVQIGPWPIRLYGNGAAIEVRLHGRNHDLYDSNLDRSPGTNLAEHYPKVLQAAIDAKSGKNRLSDRRPNVVAINLAVQEEFQVGSILLRDGRFKTPILTLPADIDGAIWFISGINRKVTLDDAQQMWRDEAHPMRTLLHECLDAASAHSP